MSNPSLSELVIYTVGHSNRSFEDFLFLLQGFDIQALVDIRSFPSSAKYPHFNKANLERMITEHGIQYVWIKKLGGFRRGRGREDSPNTALRSLGFRNYADYMGEEEFRDGVRDLLSIAAERKTAYMCAEALYWRCHRRLLSDYLASRGITVFHIMTPNKLAPHKISADAVVTSEGGIIYPEI